uniref:Uncharacterized protein n=1 Tax=Arundo donax TaxID=35708 RepID=A0A0A9BNZ4_ARUDO
MPTRKRMCVTVFMHTREMSYQKQNIQG